MGTLDDNNKDKARKGRCRNGSYVGMPSRGGVGSSHYGAILNERTAARIKRLIRKGLRVTEIVRICGTTMGAVYGIRSGKTWKHVP
jgi:hypothetical protein